jgi:hypothetical protein
MRELKFIKHSKKYLFQMIEICVVLDAQILPLLHKYCNLEEKYSSKEIGQVILDI